MKKNIIILVGPPNSGKSTWTKSFIMNNKTYLKVSRDDFRRMLSENWVVSHEVENLITRIQIKSIIEAIESGFDVIVDNTHCKISYINELLDQILKEFPDVIIKFKLFDVDRHTLMERNEYRSKIDGKYIPENVMENMIKGFNHVKNNFDFSDYLLIN